jgi:hypothetical protein
MARAHLSRGVAAAVDMQSLQPVAGVLGSAIEGDRPALVLEDQQAVLARRKDRAKCKVKESNVFCVRPDQVVAARGVGDDFSALHAYAAQVLRARPNA